MAKKASKSAVSPSKSILLSLLLVLLFALLVLIIAGKYYSLKSSTRSYMLDTTQSMSTQAAKDTIEQAQILSTSLTEGFDLTDSTKLENYIVLLHEQLDKDVVVLDSSKTILADAVPSNVGTKYTSDLNREITQTLTDGVPRTFIEKSKDYPKGISEVVVPLRDSGAAIVGVVIISSLHIHQ